MPRAAIFGCPSLKDDSLTIKDRQLVLNASEGQQSCLIKIFLLVTGNPVCGT
ncbi:hypothetical protein EPYR_02925 [Erwinia pyrifoliae DSM 12163]|nr:uncharacterized protein EpC_26910 [Erwinia pyrifoliae Ep1/96]CAY75305.1 hypothetical protein EPYR_02925 [Erwinia pyrifoliae DSM 12163]